MLTREHAHVRIVGLKVCAISIIRIRALLEPVRCGWVGSENGVVSSRAPRLADPL